MSFDTGLVEQYALEREALRQEVVHLMSLLHALALLSLRCDRNLNNIKQFAPGHGDKGFPTAIHGNVVQVVSSRSPETGFFETCARQLTLGRYGDSLQRYYERNPLHVIGGITDDESTRTTPTAHI